MSDAWEAMSASPEDPIAESSDSGNGLMLDGAPFGLEKIYDYEAGGHHPVHLGDHIGGNERYLVLHKLGNGGSANVWLCRDLEAEQTRYVALKILMAESSSEDCPELRVKLLRDSVLEQNHDQHICLPLDDFRIDGPNGTHVCIVYPVLGPRVSRDIAQSEERNKMLRRIASQATQTMAALHDRGICHGDFTPSNVLLRTKDLDVLSEEELMQALGVPQRVPVTTASGEPPTSSSAPQYLVRPLNWDDAASRFVTTEACAIDFGESFDMAHPPGDLGTPPAYRSPELLLDGTVSKGCDLWALGCTLFEIRTGRQLFNMFDDDSDDHLFAMVLMLGPLPEPWWTTWNARKDCFEDETDAGGRAIKVAKLLEQDAKQNQSATTFVAEPRSIKEALATGLDYDGLQPSESVHLNIAENEIEIFADLLRKLLRHRPEDRLEAADVLHHDWFKM